MGPDELGRIFRIESGKYCSIPRPGFPETLVSTITDVKEIFSSVPKLRIRNPSVIFKIVSPGYFQISSNQRCGKSDNASLNEENENHGAYLNFHLPIGRRIHDSFANKRVRSKCRDGGHNLLHNIKKTRFIFNFRLSTYSFKLNFLN